MRDYHIEGIGRMNGGEYGIVSVEGVTTCSSDIKADSISIEGVFHCSGKVETGVLYCEGTSNFSSDIRAKKMTVEGIINLKGNAKIEAEEIICEGVIRAGEISADRIYSDGYIRAKEIVGDEIKINTRKLMFVRLFTHDFSNIELIEATTIDLSGVNAKSVNGKDVVIGPHCQIDSVDCSGTLFIDNTSSVKTITGDYTRRA